MTNKIAKYTYGGANQDVTQSKHQNIFYYDAEHIRIISSDKQTTGSVENEKGHTLIITIPNISIDTANSAIYYSNGEAVVENYSGGNEIDQQVTDGLLPILSIDQKIIGATATRTGIVLFTTDNKGFDCVWNINNIIQDNYSFDLIYVRNLGFSTDRPIQAIFNYENENIQKVYWVDGLNQIRFLNLTHESIDGNGLLLDIPSTSINFVGTVDFSQPVISDVVGGGSHTAGVIQYAYNLYRLNSTQTKISPLSDLVPLGTNGFSGGGDLNEIVSATPVVTIDDIDQAYTNIKVYAIKYTSLNQLPSVTVIEDRAIDGNSSITVYDDGTNLEEITLEEFLFLGSDPYTPKHIESKDNRLFLANITTEEFVLPDELDCRAYSFNSSRSCNIYENIVLSGTGVTGTKLTFNYLTNYNVPEKHDAVNLNYDTFKYQSNGTTLGGEGKYIKYELTKKTEAELEDDVENYRFFKDQEIYRIGILFYNKLGQTSVPKWIADFKAPSGNLEGSYNTLTVELKSEFYTWLDSFEFEKNNKPVGYRIVRADRTNADKTILAQGPINGMMVNVLKNGASDPALTLAERREAANNNPKLPNFLMRTFQDKNNNAGSKPLQGHSDLMLMMFVNGDPANQGNDLKTSNPNTEIQFDIGGRNADTFQYNKMMQLYSPEVLFMDDTFSPNLLLQVKGMGLLQNNYCWYQRRNITTQIADQEVKVTGGLTSRADIDSSITRNPIAGNPDLPFTRGLIHNPNNADDQGFMAFIHWYRDFTGYTKAINRYTISPIYGRPEITERGQDRTIYNRNPDYEYANTLEGFVTDGEEDFGDNQLGLTSINSFGSKCATIVLGTESTSTRLSIENLYNISGIFQKKGTLICEIKKGANEAYLGNIYGGISYEDKKRTNYIQIGNYLDIQGNINAIDSPGDTFVQVFKFLRIGKTDTEILQYNVNQISELVAVKLETTIDLKNRNDISNFTWDSEFQPRESDYHKYNTVYSQQPNLIVSSDTDFNFRRVKQFDTRIQSTKVKTPNESIDSWTDILQNEIMDLNGKFGPINNIIEFKDNIFAFQDEAIASITINPRIQVQGSDNIGIELGTGSVLYDYNYLTTTSGAINKWGMTKTKSGIYYYDAFNKGIGRVPNNIGPLLSDLKGLHSFFNTNYDYSFISQDNPIKQAGALIGYDNYNNDIYITLLQGDKSFTWVFNELQDQFIDRKLYIPSKYIYKGEKFISFSNNAERGYEHYTGDYNVYHATNYPSTITLQLNPDSDYDKVFNNIFFNSEVYLEDIDQPDKTLTHITAYNEYQTSGRIPLVSGRNNNLRRKFREWKANIPRDGRNRIRNPWIFLKLEFDNSSNYRMVLHDIIVAYSI